MALVLDSDDIAVSIPLWLPWTWTTKLNYNIIQVFCALLVITIALKKTISRLNYIINHCQPAVVTRANIELATIFPVNKLNLIFQISQADLTSG